MCPFKRSRPLLECPWRLYMIGYASIAMYVLCWFCLSVFNRLASVRIQHASASCQIFMNRAITMASEVHYTPMYMILIPYACFMLTLSLECWSPGFSFYCVKQFFAVFCDNDGTVPTPTIDPLVQCIQDQTSQRALEISSTCGNRNIFDVSVKPSQVWLSR